MIYWFVLLLTCCYCTATFTFDDRNLKECDCVTDDIIYEKIRSKDLGLITGLMTEEVVPVDLPGKTITCIHVIELYGDGTGGYALISAGGLGHSYVNITLRSEILRSYAFKVIVHAKSAPPPSQGQTTAAPSQCSPAAAGVGVRLRPWSPTDEDLPAIPQMDGIESLLDIK